MTLTAGVASLIQATGSTAQLTATPATGGTAPYAYQWYRSITTGFSPGGGNIISGATTLDYLDSGLLPNTTYYYVVVVTDAASATANYAQITVVEPALSLSQNQFQQVPYPGTIDMRFPYNTVSVMIDTSQVTPLVCGAPVKIVDSAGGVPKVVGCSADTDEVFGYLNYSGKDINFPAGAPAEISQSGNYVWLYATAAIARGAQVQLDGLTGNWPNGVGVKTITGSSGANVVGYAYDKATAPNQLIRVRLDAPSYKFA